MTEMRTNENLTSDLTFDQSRSSSGRRSGCNVAYIGPVYVYTPSHGSVVTLCTVSMALCSVVLLTGIVTSILLKRKYNSIPLYKLLESLYCHWFVIMWIA